MVYLCVFLINMAYTANNILHKHDKKYTKMFIFSIRNFDHVMKMLY